MNDARVSAAWPARWMTLCLLAMSLAAVAPASAREGAGVIDGPLLASNGEVRRAGAGDVRWPLVFEENRGQADATVALVGRARGLVFLLRSDEVVFVLPGASGDAPPAGLPRLRFVDGAPDARVSGIGPLAGRVNYLLGDEPRGWRTGVPTYATARYHQVYPGVDVVFYGNESRLEYDLVLAPGADPHAVALDFEGFSERRVNAEGALVLQTGAGVLVQHAPRVYQVRDGERHEVRARYELAEGSRVRFRLGEYDPALALVIDPVIEFSSAFGGHKKEETVAVATDAHGDIWLAGSTDSADLPVDAALSPPWQPLPGGKRDAFLAKFSADGATLLSATYFGGSKTDRATAVAVSASGEVVLAGYTDSHDLPVMGAGQLFNGGKDDIFVARFDADGGTLLFSTYLGGDKDERASGVAVDEFDEVFVVGYTRSPDGVPGAAGQSEEDVVDGRDALIAKLGAAGALVYLRYVGGEKDDEATAVALVGGVDPVVAGITKSKDFPVLAARQGEFGGGKNDAFVVRLDGVSGEPMFATYHGGGKEDEAHGVAVDGVGNIVVVGLTKSKDDFPLVNAMQAQFGGDQDGFVSRLSADGALLHYSTYLGGKKKDAAHAVAVDTDGAAHVVGETKSKEDFPLLVAVQPGYGGGGSDAFAAKLKGADGALVFASFLGGDKDESALAVAVVASSRILVAGLTKSAEAFPGDDGEPPLSGDKDDAFVTLLVYAPPVLAFVNPTDGQILDDDTVEFAIGYSAGEAALDLDTFTLLSNGVDVTAFTSVGPGGASYTQGLPEGENTATASIADVNGLSASQTVSFLVEGTTFRAIADCAPTTGTVPLSVRFQARGEFSGGSIVRYRWDFDGNGSFDSSDSVARDYTRIFSQQGTIDAVLEVTNNLGETATDVCRIVVSGNPPTASANASPSNGPIPLDVALTCSGSDSDGSIVLYEWDFEGDGTFDFSDATSGTVTHTYASEGTFIATCRVTDNDGFTGTARATTTTIRPGPPGSPSVTASASPGAGNAPLNVSLNGSAVDDGSIVLWEWDFEGDGTFDFSSPTSPATSHSYTAGGIFAATLRATDDEGKTGTDSVEVVANVNVSLSILDDTLDIVPGNPGATARIGTTLSATLPVTLVLRNEAGEVVRTLVAETRAAGSYEDEWDGNDDAGALLPQGSYYAVLQYLFAGETRELDLTNTTGGSRSNPPRSRLPRTFSPLAGQPLTITYTLTQAAEVTAFMGRFRVDTRLVTFFERVPMGRGTHVLTWNGENADGQLIHPPPGDSFLFGIFRYTLPSNAIFLHSGADVTAVSVTPSIFDPTGIVDDQGTPARSLLQFDLGNAADVELTVEDAETGARLALLSYPGLAAGTNVIGWDGRTENGVLVAPGRYRLGLAAIDSTGYRSIRVYALQRVYY